MQASSVTERSGSCLRSLCWIEPFSVESEARRSIGCYTHLMSRLTDVLDFRRCSNRVFCLFGLERITIALPNAYVPCSTRAVVFYICGVAVGACSRSITSTLWMGGSSICMSSPGTCVELDLVYIRRQKARAVDENGKIWVKRNEKPTYVVSVQSLHKHTF